MKKRIIVINESQVESLMDKPTDSLQELYDYLSLDDNQDIHDVDANGRKIPNLTRKAHNYFIPKGIVKDVWAVHFTNVESYEGIIQNGFSIGVTDFDKLAYSGGIENAQEGGWCFALPLDNDYLGEDCGYGDCGFIIKTDGVRAFHKGDNDDEIIFKDENVKEKIPFVYDEDFECWILTDEEDIDYDIDKQLPKGAYFDEDIETVVFENLKDLINYAIGRQ